MENKQQRPIFLGFSSQKGGVGKSTLAEIVSSILYYEQGINLFVVDCDLSPFSSVSIQELRNNESSTMINFLRNLYEKIQRKSCPMAATG